MGTFAEFVDRLYSGLGLADPGDRVSDVKLARRFLAGLNEYFYQTHDGIGATKHPEDARQYFSEFHKFWEANYKTILNPRVDRRRARVAAKCLSRAVRRYGREVLSLNVDTHGLSRQAIAQVRFLTANQDFRGSLENQLYERYLDDPSRFDPRVVATEPGNFLTFIGVSRSSQSDKRVDFASNAARFLLKRKATAFTIARQFGNDAMNLRSALVEAPNMGYGPKKANMFLRDMAELGVWPTLANLDQIDVASDRNTMKVALRAGILKFDAPLVSSFLDIFGYQYALVYELSAQAWRTVWEKWRIIDPETAPDAPCRMDYVLYRIGREHCKDIAVRYECERGHRFYHLRGTLMNCRVCSAEGERVPASPRSKWLPCQLASTDLPRNDDRLDFGADKLLTLFDGTCILEGTCRPKVGGFQPLDPPESISIEGRTGWTQSYSYRGRGGGGLMA